MSDTTRHQPLIVAGEKEDNTETMEDPTYEQILSRLEATAATVEEVAERLPVRGSVLCHEQLLGVHASLRRPVQKLSRIAEQVWRLSQLSAHDPETLARMDERVKFSRRCVHIYLTEVFDACCADDPELGLLYAREVIRHAQAGSDAILSLLDASAPVELLAAA